MLDHCDDASPIAGWLPEMRYRAGMARIIRARFALWIRAVLRADAGDFGHYFKTCTDDRCDCWGRKTWNSRRIRPLWERAPKTRAR